MGKTKKAPTPPPYVPSKKNLSPEEEEFEALGKQLQDAYLKYKERFGGTISDWRAAKEAFNKNKPTAKGLEYNIGIQGVTFIDPSKKK